MFPFLLHLSHTLQTLLAYFAIKFQSFIQNQIKTRAPDPDVGPQSEHLSECLQIIKRAPRVQSTRTCFIFSQPNAIVSELIDYSSICSLNCSSCSGLCGAGACPSMRLAKGEMRDGQVAGLCQLTRHKINQTY